MLNSPVPGFRTPKDVKRSWKPLHQKEQYGNKEYDKALFLSAYFGMYGLDQIYLGNKVRGLIKLLTAGGLGVIWLVDFYRIINGKMLDDQHKHLLYERPLPFYDSAPYTNVVVVLGIACYLPVVLTILLLV